MGSMTASFSGPLSSATMDSNYGSAMGDMNGDGLVDLLTTDSSYQLSVWLNETPALAQTPNFVSAPPYRVTTVAWTVAVGDLNRDGKLDAVTIGTYTVSVLLGQ
jgi:hypothetical protein